MLTTTIKEEKKNMLKNYDRVAKVCTLRPGQTAAQILHISILVGKALLI